MAASKTLTKLIAQRGARTSVRTADELAALQRASDQARLTAAESDSLTEYVQTQGRLDNQTQGVLAQTSAEVEAAEALELEQLRLTSIDGKNRIANLDHQAVSPEEYKGRLSQLRNQEYAEDMLNKADPMDNMPNPFDMGTTHGDRYRRWDTDGKVAQTRAMENTELQQWASTGAYTRKSVFGEGVDNPDAPAVFFRMDIKADPRGELSPIQFDPEAREFGMHVGSRQAGMDIISPTVRADNAKRIKDIRASFASIGEENLDLFNNVMINTRKNLFLRYGEKPFEIGGKPQLDAVIDEFFAELDIELSSRGVTQLDNMPNPNVMKERMRSVMRGVFDESQHPVWTNAKQGLVVADKGNNTARNIAKDLSGRGIFDDDALQTVINAGGNAAENVALRDLLRTKGYDHLVYLNDAEDRGVMSIVLFDEANYQNLYKPTLGRKGGTSGHKATISALLAPIAEALETDGDVR